MSSTPFQRGQADGVVDEVGELTDRQFGAHRVVSRPHPLQRRGVQPLPRSICSAHTRHRSPSSMPPIRRTVRRAGHTDGRDATVPNYVAPTAGRGASSSRPSRRPARARTRAAIRGSRLRASPADRPSAPHSQPRYMKVERRHLPPPTKPVNTSAATSTFAPPRVSAPCCATNEVTAFSTARRRLLRRRIERRRQKLPRRTRLRRKRQHRRVCESVVPAQERPFHLGSVVIRPAGWARSNPRCTHIPGIDASISHRISELGERLIHQTWPADRRIVTLFR